MTSIPMSCALDAAQNLRTQVASLAEYPNTDRPSGESAHRDRERRECGHALPMSALARLVRPQEGVVKRGFVENIEDLTVNNNDFRRVIYTAHHMQLVLMSLGAGEDIGEEVHEASDQFFRIETGTGEVWMNGVATAIKDGCAIVIPAGVRHNIKNTGRTSLKVYTLYAPPHHANGTVHATRADAEAADEHFAGKTSE
jgi:mannose-6-phosphate isomerase-like protein (cupin superfamily)